MSLKKRSDSSYTTKIKTLINKVHTTSVLKDSVYEEATDYFYQLPEFNKRHNALKDAIAKTEEYLSSCQNSGNWEKLQKQLKVQQKKLRMFELEQEDARLKRLHKIKAICQEILEMCTGSDEEDTNRKRARFLGTLLLISQTDQRQAIRLHHKCRHLYMAVIGLALMDEVLREDIITNRYILERRGSSSSSDKNVFIDEVQIPFIMTCLLIDVGNCHPDAQKILKGEEGQKDEFRILDNAERKKLLKIDYQQDLHYFVNGLGQEKYIGNSKDEREVFNQKEKAKVQFMCTLLKSSLQPEKGVGNLIKVPQIYTSVVMYTKTNLTYATLPKAFMLLNKGAKAGHYCQDVVDSLLKITGIFPQGFGVTYIPQDVDGQDLDRYEYAIVNALYPENPYCPKCRAATRNLTFNAIGSDNRITQDHNLYFPETRKQLEKVGEERLKEILSKLWNNFGEHSGMEELIPQCWQPYEYFCDVRFQNLWNKHEGKQSYH